MSIRERMLSVYRNEMPDRLPVGIYARFLLRGEFERECRTLGLGLLDAIPLVSLVGPTWHVLDGYVSEVKNARFTTGYAWESGQAVVTHSYDTPVGQAVRCSTVHPETRSEWVRKHYIQSEDDYDAVQYLVENTVFSRRDAEFDSRVREMGGDGLVLARIDRSGYQKLIIELGDPQQVMTDLYTQPEKPERLIQTLNERLEEQFAMVLDSSAEVIWHPENLSADMTPPAVFERYCLPLYRKFARQCREAGKVYVVHMDGRLDALKELIGQAPISVVESFSLPEMANDLAFGEAAERWSPTVISPNFPAALCDADEATIRTRLDALVAEVGRERPFLLSVSEDLPRDSYSHVLPILCSYFAEGPKA